MRKNAGFAIAAVGFTLAMMLFATSSIVETSADVLRPKAGIPQVASANSFLPAKVLDPAW